MELNRNHYFTVGLILLAIGIQLRFVESYRLTEEGTRFVTERLEKKQASTNPLTLLSVPTVNLRMTIAPPSWIGWSLISVGAVLVLQSLAMRKPGG